MRSRVSFGFRPNFTPYTAAIPSTPLNERNTAAAPLAGVSGTQNLTVEDAIDEQQFNQAIWQSVRGTDVPMPAPRYGLQATGADVGQQPATPPTEGDNDDH